MYRSAAPLETAISPLTALASHSTGVFSAANVPDGTKRELTVGDSCLPAITAGARKCQCAITRFGQSECARQWHLRRSVIGLDRHLTIGIERNRPGAKIQVLVPVK